jgi:glucose/arabinose dehydrogenase
MKIAFRISAVLAIAACAGLPAAAQDRKNLEGAAAFGDWRSDAPGVRRKITAPDLPAPYATRGASSSSRVVARGANAKPIAPAGFKVELLASGLDEPRVLRTAPNGDVFISETGAGRIRVMRASGATQEMHTFATGLAGVFGIAFYPPGPEPQYVYAATSTRVVRFAYRNGDLKASAAAEPVVQGIAGGGHSTRDIGFSPDGATLYVSVGSASNAAEGITMPAPAQIAIFEKANGVGATWAPETGRAVVLAFDADGQNRRTFATGIRNCAGLAISPRDGAPWCAVNERDMLGDDLPPDYATRVREGGFYGWPWYYMGDNEDPRHKGARRDLAGKAIVPDVLIQPHSAPLGIAFYEGSQFPEDYKGGAFVTLHGSWNRAKRTGYKVVRLLFRDGAPTGEYEDFLTGFVVSEDAVWGRPVGVAVAKDGSLLVSEDAAGTIWRVSYEK